MWVRKLSNSFILVYASHLDAKSSTYWSMLFSSCLMMSDIVRQLEGNLNDDRRARVPAADARNAESASDDTLGIARHPIPTRRIDCNNCISLRFILRMCTRCLRQSRSLLLRRPVRVNLFAPLET